MTDKPHAIIWFRDNLRLSDNPALHAALDDYQVVPVYIHDETDENIRKLGGASKWWLHHALASLKSDLKEKGADLLMFNGKSEEVLRALCKATSAKHIFMQKSFIKPVEARDKNLKEALEEDEITLKQYAGYMLFDHDHVKTKTGDVYKVFTPFWKACRANAEQIKAPLETPAQLSGASNLPKDDGLDALKLLPIISWDGGLQKRWNVSEKGAYQQLDHFLKNGLKHYSEGRDYPSKEHTSNLSPYLHFGMISPRTIYHEVKGYVASLQADVGKPSGVFLSELGWREFSSYLLYHFPHMEDKPFQKKFEHFPWGSDDKALKLWQQGKTGYPLVDAGMRELWQTGFMHNRVRMVVGSFLIKHLQIHWKEGEAWFWDTLVDANYGSNIGNWQWVAGCGADASPYFRVFNPILQSTKFDAADYIRTYVPELKTLSDKEIHTPWELDNEVLDKAGIMLGKDYPHPIVDHANARKRALAAYDKIKGN